MSRSTNSNWLRFLDLPLLVSLVVTGLFYLVIIQEPFAHSLIYRYTTEHTVEYVIVAFLFWGLTDVAFHCVRLPREKWAVRQIWFPRRGPHEPVSRAVAYQRELESRPQWLQSSRIGRRFGNAFEYLVGAGSADRMNDQLRHLSDMDLEQTQSNYALLRFICWVTPMFGFLGTVIHFGTALGGQGAEDLGDKLPTVVAEMGTAFNTTTVALIAATTMMFSVFLCERVERGILLSIDQRVEQELANRFETADPTIAPFLHALDQANQVSIQAMQATVNNQVQLWSEVIERLEHRWASQDAEREQSLLRAIDVMHKQRGEQALQLEPVARVVSGLQVEVSRFLDSMHGMTDDRGHLVAMQKSLSDNLRILHESRQIDQAVHELTAAIHLLTARSQSMKAA